MRAALALLVVIAAPAAAGVPFPSGGSGSSAVRTQPLAPGELLLETGGVAYITTPADRATFHIEVQGSGATRAEAEAAARAEVERVVGIVRQAGIPESAVDRQAAINALLLAAAATDPATGPEVAGNSLTIRDIDVARLEPLRAALHAAGVTALGEPTYSLADAGPARRRAQAEAFARARADADDYAAALGMHVLRIVRITDRTGMDMFNILLSRASELPRPPGGEAQQQTDPDIPAIAMVGVDFALAPR